MAEDSQTIARLEADILVLKEQLANVSRNYDLVVILVFLLFVIVLAVVISLWKHLFSQWKEYEYVILPPTEDAADMSVRVHDIFNIVVLPPLVLLDFNYLIRGNFDDPYNHNFWVLTVYTLSYIVVDMVWVAIVPNSVKSQATILVHHAVTIIYVAIPVYDVACRYTMGVCLLVELNTWFLILRRHPVCLKPSVKPFIKWPFYISWYAIRVVLYPMIIFHNWGLFQQHVDKMKASGDPSWVRASYGVTYMIMPVVFQIMLSALNVHWTIKLIQSDVKRRRNRSKALDKGL